MSSEQPDNIPSNFSPCLNGMATSDGTVNEAAAIRVSAVTGGTSFAVATGDRSPDVSFGLVLKGVLWNKKVLTVSMLPPIEIPGVVQAIIEIASRWTENLGLQFQFLNSPDRQADIRIKFTEKGAFWSMVGTNSSATSASGASMNLGFDHNTINNRKEVERLILHEFGHALGLAHEHQNQQLSFNMGAAVNYFQRNGLGHLSPSAIQKQFEQYKESEIDDRSSRYDVDSIMLYSFPPEIASPTKYNYQLSKTDLETVQKLYPAEQHFLPARTGMEIEVDGDHLTAYYLFGEDEGLFYFRAEKAGKYKINVTSQTGDNVVDPYAKIPVFLSAPASGESDQPTQSLVDIGLLNSSLLFGTSFVVYPEATDGDDRKPADQPLADSELVVEMNGKEPPNTSKIVNIPSRGWYYIKTRISEPKGQEPCRFVLSVNSA